MNTVLFDFIVLRYSAVHLWVNRLEWTLKYCTHWQNDFVL